MMAAVGLWAVATALATAALGIPFLVALDRSKRR